MLVAALSVGCGGGKGKSSSGGGGSTSSTASATTTTNVVGPNLNGDWAGYYKSVNGNYQNLTATISHTGSRVVITTSVPEGSIIHELIGQIDASGNMLLYDQFDNEDWTTLYGPASTNSINLADFVFINQSLSDTNILILKR